MFSSVRVHDAPSARAGGFFHVSIGTLYSVAMEPDLVQRNLPVNTGKSLLSTNCTSRKSNFPTHLLEPKLLFSNFGPCSLLVVKMGHLVNNAENLCCLINCHCVLLS